MLYEVITIIETNRAWQEFAVHNGMKQPVDSIGVNYLNICERAGVGDGPREDDAWTVAEGIQKVLSDELPEFFT